MPTASADTAATPQGTPVTIAVLANDTARQTRHTVVHRASEPARGGRPSARGAAPIATWLCCLGLVNKRVDRLIVLVEEMCESRSHEQARRLTQATAPAVQLFHKLAGDLERHRRIERPPLSPKRWVVRSRRGFHRHWLSCRALGARRSYGLQ